MGVCRECSGRHPWRANWYYGAFGGLAQFITTIVEAATKTIEWLVKSLRLIFKQIRSKKQSGSTVKCKLQLIVLVALENFRKYSLKKKKNYTKSNKREFEYIDISKNKKQKQVIYLSIYLSKCILIVRVQRKFN